MLYSLPALLVLLVITFLLVRGAASIMSKQVESASRLKELEAENVVLRERQASLEGQIGKLKTEEGVVEEIRAKFNATRAGEHLVVIVEEKPTAATTTPTAMERLKRGWQSFLNLWPF